MLKDCHPSSCRVLLSTVLIILFIATSYSSSGQKNDTVYFLNDDRISGEIKQYKYGFMSYKTYGVSTVKVKYDKLSTFFSNKSFDVLLKDGARRFGSFDTSQMRQFVKIITSNDTLLTPIIEIVEFTPIKKRFWGRLSGNVDIGFGYTKANTLTQFSFNSSLKYTQRLYFTTFVINSLNTMQSNQENSRTKKNDATITLYRRIKKNWFAVGTGASEQNTELGLNLRLQLGAGVTNELIHTNSNNLLTGFGVVVNNEWSADTTLTRLNVDGYGSVQYRLFRFKDPEIDITSNFIVFPSMTVADRWRANYDIKFKFKIVSDMYLSFSFYINYDSKPPSETSQKIDYSFSSTFGYSF